MSGCGRSHVSRRSSHKQSGQAGAKHGLISKGVMGLTHAAPLSCSQMVKATGV